MRRLHPLGLVVGALLVLVTTAGCGGAGGERIRVAVDSSDFGQTVDVPADGTVEIELAENPTTGFEWHCSWVPEGALAMSGNWYSPDPAPPDFVTGGGGTRHFRLAALQTGEVTVTLQYGQWWPGGEREDPQTITLNVGE